MLAHGVADALGLSLRDASRVIRRWIRDETLYETPAPRSYEAARDRAVLEADAIRKMVWS